MVQSWFARGSLMVQSWFARGAVAVHSQARTKAPATWLKQRGILTLARTCKQDGTSYMYIQRTGALNR